MLKEITAFCLALILLAGCAATQGQNQTTNNSSSTSMSKTQQAALIGGLLGAIVGGTTKGDNKMKRVLIGGAVGAAVGGGIGYSIDQQAKDVADTLNTDVNNNPNAVLDTNKDIIVSNTDKYVKIVFRDDMMFQSNSSVPTYQAEQKIANVSTVLNKYPDTLIQVVGHTDNRGTYEYNQKLSVQRAENVGNSINNSGIKNEIFSKGCSFHKPVVVNSTKENMALNRRVEIFLYPNYESVVEVCK